MGTEDVLPVNDVGEELLDQTLVVGLELLDFWRGWETEEERESEISDASFSFAVFF